MKFNRKSVMCYNVDTLYWTSGGKLILLGTTAYRVSYKIMQQEVKKMFDLVKKAHEKYGPSSYCGHPTSLAGMRVFTLTNRNPKSHKHDYKLRYQYPKHLLKCTKNLL